MTYKGIAAGALLIVLLYLALAYGIYTSLTSRVSGANDFYSRWSGARALFLEGRDPYSSDVTQSIQLGMRGRLSTPEEDQVAFAYPLYVAFLMLPLVALPYAQAQALWMAALVLAVVGGALVLSRLSRVPMTPALVLLITLGALFYYPSARAILLGQFAIISFLCLVLAAWAIQERQDLAAGVLLALATVKPQLASLLVPFVLAWGFRQRRWRLVGGAASTLLALVVLACFWIPTWPLEFWQGMVGYTNYIHVGAPVQTALSLVMPSDWVGPAALVAGMVLVVIAAAACLRSTDDIAPAFNLTAFVTAWVAIRIGSSDQVLLLFPWLFWLLRLWQSGNRLLVVALWGVIVVIPWLVFLSTIRGDAESPLVTLVLPLLTLLAYVAAQFRFDLFLQRRHFG
ncbi:MAG: glycosyltransferase family 87 protein [Acidobacteriota bacterium]